MASSQITKRALSNAMKELMAKYPMEKVKVGEICKLCNMNRQSFYYHFKDKYDLVNWIFYTECLIHIKASLDKPGWDVFEQLCEFFYKDRTFYSNAFSVRGQNSLSEYFNEMMYPLFYSKMHEILQADRNIEFSATFFADAIRTAITRWLLEGAQQTPKVFVKQIMQAITGTAYKMIKSIGNEDQPSE